MSESRIFELVEEAIIDNPTLVPSENTPGVAGLVVRGGIELIGKSAGVTLRFVKFSAVGLQSILSSTHGRVRLHEVRIGGSRGSIGEIIEVEEVEGQTT